MTGRATSRRMALRAGGACTLAATVGAATAGISQMALADVGAGVSSTSEETVRKWYAAWDTKDLRLLTMLMADDFTFSSPLDDHISRMAYKTQCWDTQHNLIDRFDLLRVFGSGNEAFVLYNGYTKKGNIFRNVEYFQLRDDKVKALECYFGGQDSFPSSVDTGRT